MFLSEAQKRELEDLRYLKCITTHPRENSHLATAEAAAWETRRQVHEPTGEFQRAAEKQCTGLILHPLPCGAQLRDSFSSPFCTSLGNASRNGRHDLLRSWEVSELLGGSTLCSCMAMQMNPAVHPGDAPRNGSGGALGIHLRCAPRKALGMHPGEAPTRHAASLFALVQQMPFNLTTQSQI